MKYLFIVLVCLGVIYYFGRNDNTPEERQKVELARQTKQLKLIAKRDLIRYKYFQTGANDTQTIIIDSCEYVVYMIGNKGFMAHRGDCKYCRQYLKQCLKNQ